MIYHTMNREREKKMKTKNFPSFQNLVEATIMILRILKHCSFGYRFVRKNFSNDSCECVTSNKTKQRKQ